MAFFGQQMTTGAIISPCERYRYKLWRVWDMGKPAMLWVMLNPSKANATDNDATIRWLISYASKHGFGGIVVVNLFAYRATVPADMMAARDPVGPENDKQINAAVLATRTGGGRIVLGWGAHGGHMDRDLAVFAMLKKVVHAYKLQSPACLGVTKNGQPMHPVRLSHDLGLRPYEGRTP